MTTPLLQIRQLAVHFNGAPILQPLSLDLQAGEILAVIGPANSGKTTFLRALNRMADLDRELRVTGEVHLNGKPVFGPDADVVDIRRRIGIVFSVPIPLPMSIYDNLVFGLKLHGITESKEIRKRVEESLQASYLWEEVKDRLDLQAVNLSGGQQQRLCLARTLMVQPEVLLLDEPCSGLDPISTAKIEEALSELKKQIGVILVTNNVKQASRVSDRTLFLLMGEQVEVGPTTVLFTTPRDERTEAYITGRFG
ncbi:MAG: phosphate ABC transporter ATP-binding protein [Elusimicrobiota bacterium]